MQVNINSHLCVLNCKQINHCLRRKYTVLPSRSVRLSRVIKGFDVTLSHTSVTTEANFGSASSHSLTTWGWCIDEPGMDENLVESHITAADVDLMFCHAPQGLPN